MIEELSIVLNTLNKNGYEAYLVGGGSRDHLLKSPVHDYDVCTNAHPNTIKMLFSNYVIYDIGKKLGTIAVLIHKIKIEITPFRKEGKYSDHRKPDEISFTDDLYEDLKRRDFTINALCINAKEEVVDLFSGIEDLNNKVIRCIGNPDERFHEDALRILRALRFHTKLEFAIEENTKKSIFQNKDLLNYISNERKKEELLQILRCSNCFETINEFLPIFQTFMPFETEEKKYNPFSNSLYTLAYLLRKQKINLKALKYSKEEISLIETLIDAYHQDIKEDYDFICLLSNIHQSHILSFLNELYPTDFTKRYLSLKEYMITINDLAISGFDLMKLNYQDEQIRNIKVHLLDKIHHQELKNNRNQILDYLNTI